MSTPLHRPPFDPSPAGSSRARGRVGGRAAPVGAALVLAAALSGASGIARAQSLEIVAERPVRAFVGFGLTGGGDRLITARYTDGSSYTLRGGGLLQLHAGAEFRLAPRVTMAASLGYHVDAASAANGSVSFRRFPLEALAHLEFAPGWRVGGGLRLALDPKLESDRGFFGADQRYETSLGPVLEIEYRFNRLLGLKLRGVVERYESKDGLPTVSGDHVGMFLNFYF
ncbi:MAG: hypothetical protein AB7P21_16805 [Lautropia sp.]